MCMGQIWPANAAQRRTGPIGAGAQGMVVQSAWQVGQGGQQVRTPERVWRDLGRSIKLGSMAPGRLLPPATGTPAETLGWIWEVGRLT
jgi:hypothetical protein